MISSLLGLLLALSVQFIIFLLMRNTYRVNVDNIEQDYRSNYENYVGNYLIAKKYRYGLQPLFREVSEFYKEQDKFTLKKIEKILNQYVKRQFLYDACTYMLFLGGTVLANEVIKDEQNILFWIAPVLLIVIFTSLYSLGRTTFVLQTITNIRNWRFLTVYDLVFSDSSTSDEYINDDVFIKPLDENGYVINSLSAHIAFNLLLAGIITFCIILSVR